MGGYWFYEKAVTVFCDVAACGKGAGGETEEPKQEDATEETQEETEEETAAKDNKDEEIKDDESDSTNSDLEFSLGYTAKDEDGNDLVLPLME